MTLNVQKIYRTRPHYIWAQWTEVSGKDRKDPSFACSSLPLHTHIHILYGFYSSVPGSTTPTSQYFVLQPSAFNYSLQQWLRVSQHLLNSLPAALYKELCPFSQRRGISYRMKTVVYPDSTKSNQSSFWDNVSLPYEQRTNPMIQRKKLPQKLVLHT